MKALKIAALLLVSVTMFTGCDFFRSILGKPTSKDLEKMRIEAENQAKKQRQLDSINLAEAEAQQNVLQEEQTSEEKLAVSKLDKRYYLILGSFKVESNATKMYSFLKRNGYYPERIPFTNGYDVVAIAGFNNYKEAQKEMETMKTYDYCPKDIWVYDTNLKLHNE